MGNLSLKDQLQALSLSNTPSTSEKAKSNKPKSSRLNVPAAKASPGKQKPAWLEYAQYGVELLKAYFPLCFKEIKEIQPLKIGIKQDLVKFLSTKEDIVVSDKACMVTSLSYYVNSAGYHKNMVVGAARIDLDGNPAGVVTADEAKYSDECRTAKMQKKKPAETASKTTE